MHPTVPFDRSLYEHWIDEDNDCQDTRQEVLIAESVVPVTLDYAGCRVLTGRWLDPYTGQIVSDWTRLHIDHLVPLAEAHRSGADLWDTDRKRAFANDLGDPRSLVAVTGGTKTSKSDRDPAGWLPPESRFHCEYVQRWVLVKTTWDLSMDVLEEEKIREILRNCP